MSPTFTARRAAAAGIELARVEHVDACRTTLRMLLNRLIDADDVRVRACTRDELSADELPVDPDGWFLVELRDPNPRAGGWFVELHVHATPTPERITICERLALQASIGLERLAERHDLSRHERQQHALVEAGKALSSERTLDGVLERIVEHAMTLTDAQYGALGVLDGDSSELVSFVTVGITPEQIEQIGDLPRGRGILGVLIDDPRPLRLDRLQDHSQSAGFPPNHPPMTTFLGVPIVTADSVAGRIYLTEKHGGVPFTAEDEQLVETLASQAAIAIDNVSLNERLHETAEALEEASRHKSTFLANMSHELRSPLNTIIGYTRLLLEDSDGLNEEQIEDLRIVRGSGEHLLVLITDLLDLQRIEAGRVTLVLDDEQLRPLLDWVVASVLPSVSKNVELVLEADALGDDAIRCDRTRVRQMLLNVIGNALKFTQSGSVRVIARGDEHEIRIDVVDTGPGIPRGDQARIFESFYQSTAAADKTPGPREGAGLGLAITRMLVELHGGSVTLESTEGVGTTVRIRLPRDAGSSMTEGRDA
jgi:signal transduction histidine kinase